MCATVVAAAVGAAEFQIRSHYVPQVSHKPKIFLSPLLKYYYMCYCAWPRKVSKIEELASCVRNLESRCDAWNCGSYLVIVRVANMKAVWSGRGYKNKIIQK